MCQINNVRKISDGHVRFYKVVTVPGFIPGWFSPYTETSLVKGFNQAQYKDVSKVATGEHPTEVGEGYIHCFMKFEDAELYCKNLRWGGIVEGFIPKGAVYYEGETKISYFEPNAPSYAATLVYIERLCYEK